MKKHMYKINYSSSSKYGNYDFLYELKKRLNYNFNYHLFPKYGIYHFLYDITDGLKADNSIVLLDRVIRSLDYEEIIKGLECDKRNIHTKTQENDATHCKTVIRHSNHNEGDLFEHILSVVKRRISNVDEEFQMFIRDRNIFGMDWNDKAYNVKMFREKEEIHTTDGFTTISKFILSDTLKNIGIDNEVSFSQKADIKVLDEMNDYFSKDLRLQKELDNLYLYNVLEYGLSKDSKKYNVQSEEILTEKASKATKDIFKGIIEKDVQLRKTEYHGTIEQNKLLEREDYHMRIEDAILAQKQPYSMEVENDIFADKCFEDKKLDIQKEFLTEGNKAFGENKRATDIQEPIGLIKTTVRENGINDSERIGFVAEGLDGKIINDQQKLNKNYGRVIENITKETEFVDMDGKSGRKVDVVKEKILDNFASRDLYENKSIELKRNDYDVEIRQQEILRSEKRKVEQEIEERLDLHKRFWFVKQHGKIDYKILPNTDFNYPINMNILDELPDSIYSFKYESIFNDLGSNEYVIEIYDRDYYMLDRMVIPSIKDGDYQHKSIDVNIKTAKYMTGGKTNVTFDIKLKQDNLGYIIIRQPEDITGNTVLYTITDRILSEKHPIPFGDDLGLREIPIHIPIIVDFINILLLMWAKYYVAFTGYTGIQAIYGMINVVHDWVTLDTSLEQDSIEDYHRCFRWLRWEGEKLYNVSRHDPNLSGNAWIEELIYQLIDYVEMHHMNEVPEWQPISKMDEYRNIFTDPSFDIDVVTTKFKGIRKKVLERHKKIQKNNK